MPTRAVYDRCECFLCVETSGFNDDATPKGGRILRSRMAEHQALCRAIIEERTAEEAAAMTYRESIASSLFVSTLRDDDPNDLTPKVPGPVEISPSDLIA